MLSQKARYALHALIVLANHGGDEPMMIADIADEAGVPRKFLEQILLGLKKRGIVQSLRGRAGGYRLGRPAKEISFADIIRETDGPLALSPCVSVTAYEECTCPDEASCGLHIAMKQVRDAIANILDNYKLSRVLQEVQKTRATKKTEWQFEI